MNRWSRLVLVLCLGWSCACASNATAPESPTPSISVTSVTVLSSGSVLAAGTTETFSASVIRSDGSTQTVTSGQWTSDATGVATVDGAGGVRAVSPGDATISLEVGGVRGSKRITVKANYQGRWSGNYVVTACTDTQGFAAAGACSHLFPPNSGVVYTLEFVLTQTAARVTGQALFGTTPSPWTPADVAADNSLHATSVTQATATSSAQHTWDLHLTTSSLMDGTMVMVWNDTVVSGSMTVTTRLSNVAYVGGVTAAGR